MGNVLATITDKKLQVSTNNSSTSYFEAEVQSVQDYYAFGMQMPGRTYSSGTQYAYGFGGKRKDNEMYGEGNAYDFGARIYDPRLSRWLSSDPLTAKEPGWTPYRAFYCNPIFWTDPTGMLEFKDYDSYKSHQTKNKGEVLSADKIGGQGHWLTSDRKNNTSVWNSANEFNLKNGTQNQYKAFEQIDDLYKWMDKKLTASGHEIKWVKGALTLTGKLRAGRSMKGLSEEGSFVGLLAELNEGIANLAVTEIGKALYGKKIYKGEDAYNFDLNLVTREQRDQAKPIYQKYQNKLAVAIMNDLVYSAAAPLMMDIPSFGWFRKRQCWFDIVNDWQIRVDVPLLMMYPEKHRMISDRQKIPDNVINSDGTLNTRMLRFMKDYKVK
ncbi:MAG: hypothetical protein LW852_10100 [Sediminibacterium sp.]|nr:hypothetical protein [Sediminibacterium sp.]